MLNKILVALDFSEGNPKILDFAKNMALDTGAELHLIHIVEPYTSYGIYGYTDSESALLNHYIDIAYERSQKSMKEVVGKLPAKININSEVVFGVIPTDLLSKAEEVKADAIILGSHGHGLIDTMLGSTADKLIRSAKLATFVVPVRKETKNH